MTGRSDPELLDAFRRQCLAAITPRQIGRGLDQEKVWPVFMMWLGQDGVTRDDLIDIAKEIANDPEPLMNCQPKSPQPDWSGDVPPDEEVLAEFIVTRPAPGLPSGFMPERWDGRWFSRASITAGAGPLPRHLEMGSTSARAVATGRFERRDDGALAEVYEVQSAR